MNRLRILNNKMISPCTTEETEKLEELTEPIENLLPLSDYYDKYILLLSWYRKNNLDASTSQRVKNSKLTELIGFKPQYYAVRGSDNYINAIWGFEYSNHGRGVLYNSEKGISLQVESNMGKDSIAELINLLVEKLNCN